MLQYLVENYLDSLPNERAFDATFMALLAADRYSDVHLVHGRAEFGKDVIGKADVDGVQRQFALQCKRGNVGANEWREAKAQMFEAVTNPLSHPAFDSALPRSVILVLTGRMVGNAPVDGQTFKNSMRENFPNCLIDVWDREDLISLFLRHGPEQLFRRGVDIRAYGGFYRLYGDIMDHHAKIGDIDLHFEQRLRADAPRDVRLAATLIESSLFSDVAERTNQPYLSLLSALAALRAVLFEMQSSDDDARALIDLCKAVTDDVLLKSMELTRIYFETLGSHASIADVAGQQGRFVAYAVACAQLMDALVLTCRLGDKPQREEAATTLARLVTSELGCAHPISDRYAVSVVEAISALHDCGMDEAANALLKEAAVWLVDRYWDDGAGLAPSDATEDDEVMQLLGWPFSSVAVERNSHSLLATALMDAGCLLQNREVYEGLRSDIIGANIVPRYYQPQDTRGQFEVVGKDVVAFPNVDFAEAMPLFAELQHGEHLHGEPTTYKLDALAPLGMHTAVALLLRDRYFPATWVP